MHPKVPKKVPYYTLLYSAQSHTLKVPYYPPTHLLTYLLTYLAIWTNQRKERISHSHLPLLT